jgi:exosome complex component RRP46
MTTLEDFRPMYCQLGYSTKADGSAQLSQGKTTVIAGVFGPVEVKRNRERPDRLDVEVNLLPRVGQSGVDSRNREAMIREIAEGCVRLALHPRAGVNISLHTLEEDEGITAASVNSVCLALADSGISMTCLFAAVTVAVIKDTEMDQAKIVIDPDAKRLRKAFEACVLVFAFESRNKDVLATHIQSGKCSEAKFQECLGTARKASSAIFDFYREVIKKKFSKEFGIE